MGEKKTYSAPTIHSEPLTLGVFGNYWTSCYTRNRSRRWKFLKHLKRLWRMER